VNPTHVFYASWRRHDTEAQNIQVNGAMISNLLDALRGCESVQHVALVTRLKHFLGPSEVYGRGVDFTTPFREVLARLDIDNFYYTQEDELFAAAEREGLYWTVHRPHTVIGFALGNAMNMGMTLATYGSICRETGRPLIFLGSQSQWNGLTDVTDSRLRHTITRCMWLTASRSAGEGCGDESPNGLDWNRFHSTRKACR
jgi:hypothetical protein